MVRCVTRAEPSDDEAEDAASISTYARLAGGTFPLSEIRIFGANAYGTLVPEQRQQLRLDKADKYSVYGTYIGNERRSRTVNILTAGKIHCMGAAAIDERTLLKNAPTADGLESEYKELIDEARGDDFVFSGDG